MLSPIAVPITLQLDANVIVDALMERIRSALIAGLSPQIAEPVATTAPERSQEVPLPAAPPVSEVVPVAPASVDPVVPEAFLEPVRRTDAIEQAPPVAPLSLPTVVRETETVGDWLSVYDEILTRRSYKPQTLKNHRSCIKHIARLWGAMPVRAVRPRHVTAALQDAFGDRNTLARRVLDHFRDVMQEAVINEWCDTNPVLSARRPRVRVARKRMSLETFDSMAEVAISHRQAWISPMLLLALVTGQRRADLAKMRFDDVVEGYLHVEQQKQAGKGYGARLAIPLALRLDVIGLSVGEVIELCRHYAAPGPTLLRRNDGKSIEVSSLSTRFNEVIRTALGRAAHGPSEWPSLHEMRSLSERLYRAQGIDTMTLLGHANQEMTDKYNDDRGLTAREWKRVQLPDAVPSAYV